MSVFGYRHPPSTLLMITFSWLIQQKHSFFQGHSTFKGQFTFEGNSTFQGHFTLEGHSTLQGHSTSQELLLDSNLFQSMLGEEDKRLVQSHKSLNLQLRRQLQSLNAELDRLLLLKTSAVPKKQVPSISEYLLHSNPKILQSQCDNLSKRLEQINRDKMSLKNRSQVDYFEQEKVLLQNLAHLKKQREELQRTVKSAESSAAKPTQKDPKDMYHKLERVTKELTLFRNIEKELMKHISIQEVQSIKLEGKMQETREAPLKISPLNSQHQRNINSDYAELSFTLQSLESAKIKEEAFLKFQNRSMLTEIDLLQGRSQQKRQRNYSTIDSSKKVTDRYANKHAKVDLTQMSTRK